MAADFARDFARCVRNVTCHEGIQAGSCRLKITFADDVVAFENRARLVSGHLLGYSFRHSCSHKVPDGCPAEVVNYAPKDSAALQAASQRFRKSPIGLPFFSKTKGQNVPAFFRASCSSAAPRAFPQLHSKGENPSFIVLGRTRVEHDPAGVEVDLAPLKVLDLAPESPASNVRESHERLQPHCQFRPEQ